MPKRTETPKPITLKVRAWRAANPDKQRAIQNRYQSDPIRRQRVNEYARQLAARRRREHILALGGRCVCCGETEMAFLQVDHINNDGAEDRKRGHRRSFTYSSPVQVLCANCNHAKRFGTCPHKKAEAVA